MMKGVFCFIFLILSITELKAAEYRAEYQISLGGFRLALADIQLDIQENNYRISGDMRPDGFVKKLTKELYAKGRALGELSRKRARPARFDAQWGEKQDRRRVRLLYDEGKITSFTATPPYPDNAEIQKRIIEEYGMDTTDLLSGFLQFANETGCDYSLRIFDGRRRFEMKMEPLPKNFAETENKQSIKECAARFYPQFGYKKKSFLFGGKEQIKARISYRKIGDSSLIIPDKIIINTSLGAFVFSAVNFFR